jgi:hypothetical protein
MSSFRQRIALFTTLLVLITSLGAAPVMADTIYVQTSPFIDVATNHWSFANVIKMNIRGVVAGYTNGTFMPEAPVSQLEAVLMAVRSMNMTAQIQAMDANASLPFTVPDWALETNKRELLFAVQQGLIVPAENNFTAADNATRAWMTQLIVRMIGKNGEAVAATAERSSFSDDAFIPNWARGYVNTAVKYQLISGYTDNSVKPNNDVKRSEAVAFLNRCEAHLSLSNIVKPGTLSDISATGLTMTTASGSYSFVLIDRTWIFDQNGALLPSANLSVGDKINVITNTSNQALFIEKTSGAASTPAATLPASTSKITGAVLYTVPEQNLIVVKTPDERIVTRVLAPGGTVSDSGGIKMQLADVPIDSNVELYINVSDELTQITVLTGAGSLNNQGVIYQIVPDSRLMIISTATGQYVSYQYNALLEVIVPNTRFASIDDLRVGDEVRVNVTNSVLTKVELLIPQANLTDTYTVVLAAPESNLVVLEKAGKTESYYLAGNAVISVAGISTALLSEVQKGDQVTATIVNGLISKLNILNRSASGYISGSVTAVDRTGNGTIVVRDSKGTLTSYELSASARVTVDGSISQLSRVAIDDTVEISLQSGKILYLNVTTGLEGTVNNIDYTRLLLSITTTAGAQKSYIVAEDAEVYLKGVRSPRLRDVVRGDKVVLHLGTDDLVEEIEVERVVTYTVDSVSSSRLRVSNDDEDTSLYTDNFVLIIVPGKASGSLDDFSVGDQVLATFMGDELKQLERLKSAVGRITTVNTVNNTFTVLDNANQPYTFTFGSGSLVNENGAAQKTSVSALLTGQYVQVQSQSADKVTVNVLQKITGTYVNSTSYTISVITDPNRANHTYNLYYDVVIYSGTTKYTNFTGFVVNTRLALYMLNDQVMAVERL